MRILGKDEEKSLEAVRERVVLAGKSYKQEYTATLLLVRTVEVQVT